MKKRLVPTLRVDQDYLEKFDPLIVPLDVDSGIYILNEGGQEILYYHDFNIVFRIPLNQIKNSFGIRDIKDLRTAFRKLSLSDILKLEATEVFKAGSVRNMKDRMLDGKFNDLSDTIEETSEKIYELVGRGAHRWYRWLFNECFASHHSDVISLGKDGFTIDGIAEFFGVSTRTIQRNLGKLARSNIIDFTINQDIVRELKFNVNYILGSTAALSGLFDSALFEIKKAKPITYNTINNCLEEVQHEKIDIKGSGRLTAHKDKRDHNERLGSKSEAIAADYEKNRLRALGVSKVEEKVIIVSENAALGYDIISQEINGEKRYIEVKTVKKIGKNKRFFITRNEIEKSKNLEHYYLYLVSFEQGKHRVDMLKCDRIDRSDKVILTPSEFEVQLRY